MGLKRGRTGGRVIECGREGPVDLCAIVSGSIACGRLSGGCRRVRDGVCAGAQCRGRCGSVRARCVVDAVQSRWCSGNTTIAKQDGSGLRAQVSSIDCSHAYGALSVALLQSSAAGLVQDGFQDRDGHLLQLSTQVAASIFGLDELDDVFVEGDTLFEMGSFARGAVVGDFFLYAPLALDGA